MSTLLENYQNPITLDGKLEVHPLVNEAKLARAKELFEAALAGNRIADATLAELFTSSSIGFSLTHLINMQVIPQLPEDEKQVIDGLVTTRTVRDFNPVTLLDLIGLGKFEGPGISPRGRLASIPEGTRYPIVTVKGTQDSMYEKLGKYGARFEFTWESKINDSLTGLLEQIPDALRDTQRTTTYEEIFDALDEAVLPASAVTLPDGTIVPPNAPLSVEAIIAAGMFHEQVTINNRKIGEISAYNLFLPTGGKKKWLWMLERFNAVIEEQEGSLRLRPAPLGQLLPNVTIVESDRIAAGSWKLVPKPGTTKGRPVWELLKLRGYEDIELRMKSDAGFLLSGATVDAFEGSYEADTISMRARLVRGSVLWDDRWIVASNGTGQA
ncbi:phage major capsid protein [Microbacterium sp. T32]|uniref:phage major capsid protein n=1 Tax=Microbacterium sp. T32 TaxID=1776083 RepID=UPI0007AB4A35|nr:hypothetical protein [Microbacterium sp. T32]KZE41348.1 hypothetical protein AVW09_01830 [Microbacterium sp. T32]